jgi:cobalt-zinc-cadmium efflux system outer membrane protein
MSPRLLPLAGLVLISGCLWPVRERANQAVCDLAAHPFDAAPLLLPDPLPPEKDTKKAEHKPKPADVPADMAAAAQPTDVQTVALLQAAKGPEKDDETEKRLRRYKIPEVVPGSETPPIRLPDEPEKRIAAIRQLYPPLPALPLEPGPLAGPHGTPYTLTDLQRIAAENSPTLKQAAADVEAAVGSLIQARAYPNPTVGLEADPSNNGSTTGVQGIFIDQLIKTGGKLKLAGAAAEMDLANARLAFKRARSDLATAVRTAYFTLLVAAEGMRVNRGVARFTDEIYRVQEELLERGFSAPYEPATLRAQAWVARLAYKQAISNYIYAWKQLVAAMGVRHLPLTEVAGRVDQLIPLYDYDAVLAHVLRNHTDVLTARNTLEKAKYTLKLAQVTPVPDVDVRFAVLKEYALLPFNWVHTVSIGVPLPIWDQNRGNIIAAQGALVRAGEEAHRVEIVWTSTVATNFLAYKNALDGLEHYRRHILPDQVRAYRGVLLRRTIDQAAAFADLVAAQQTYAAGVTSYLTILGQLWTAVVGVADTLQTDDLFQLAKPLEIPAVCDLSDLPPWPCHHGCPPPATPPGAQAVDTPAPAGRETPRKAEPAPQPPVRVLPQPRKEEPAKPEEAAGPALAPERPGALPPAAPEVLLLPPLPGKPLPAETALEAIGR